ncbi:LysM peptidoglycan-binding domain-containing protein [Macrococcoides bohemicum]|uniref:LysM peptidoglycan-binding domain-containing protein n=1 Tax=Macrococcoides bohemicum TaxID=1903056 RepID=UPI001059DB57|nr:LysM peptidoglycan-binding domain-containing protein [Macrococcus bohemicus]TDL37515.1 LysM peptidoglycan-binding domain-containing protein [Macrococcus bohemicus]
MKKLICAIAASALLLTPMNDADAKRYKTIRVHTVQSNDTVTSIAKKYNITPANVKKWNALVLDATYPGDRLVTSNPNKTKPIYKRSVPSKDVMVQWFYDRMGKTRYQSYAGRWGKDTWDCSSAVYAAMIEAGYLPKQTVLGDTTTMFAQENRLFIPIKKKDVRYGDIFVLGSKVNSRGALGHTGVILNKNQIIHMGYKTAYDNGIMITGYQGFAKKPGVPTYYYRINEDFVKKIKAKDVFENSLGKPVFKYKLPSR